MICRYVDQEDTLLGTLTVRETLMYSAMLRLPKNMSLQAKKVRVQQTMMELGIDHIADRKIGVPGKRGISGGEKRRVSIAQELVTSPSILFLDEPTSGLDAYNAFVVIDTIVKLAKNYNRTVVFTIHQPRTNIFAKFDQLLVLAAGEMIYSGSASDTASHFNSVGFPIPALYNPADFLSKFFSWQLTL
jgi:ABC-type multidrug transport system ATPase subunit